MFSVYVLYSERFNKIYIGYTQNLAARIESHNNLATKGYTIRFRPWKVLFTEVYHTKPEALTREKELKSARGRQSIREFISNLP